jgi:DNA-binding MarR family transcriptional regulator
LRTRGSENERRPARIDAHRPAYAMSTSPVSHPSYEESVLRSLRRITRAIDLHSRQLATRYRLTAPQLVCLRQLQREGGESTPGRLAKAIHLSQATVTGILDRLSARGLISRERSEEDRRRVIVRLTDEGTTVVRTAPSPLHERFGAALGRLSEQEKARIDVVLEQIVRMMEVDDLEGGVEYPYLFSSWDGPDDT